MKTKPEVAVLLLLVAIVLQCCTADGGKKKVVIYVPQEVKNVHHHHVSTEIRKHKGKGKGHVKYEKPLFDSWSLSEGTDDEGIHSFGTTDGGSRHVGDWSDHLSSDGRMNEEWSGIQGYIGSPGSALDTRGMEEHGNSGSSSFFSSDGGFDHAVGEDIQGTESARHEVRGFRGHAAIHGTRNSGTVLKGKRHNGYNSNVFGQGNFGSGQVMGGGPQSVRGLGSDGVQVFGGDVRNTQGLTSAGSQAFENRIPNTNLVSFSSGNGFGNDFQNQKGYNFVPNNGPAHVLGTENNGQSAGFGLGYGVKNGDNSQNGYISGGQGVDSSIISNIQGHRGFSFAPNNVLTSGSSNVFKVYNSGSSIGPSSGFQKNRLYSSGGGHGISSGISGSSFSLDGYSPDSGYASIRGRYHKELGSGVSINGYSNGHVSFGSGGHRVASSFDDGPHAGFDGGDEEESRVVEETVGGWKGWKGIRGGHRGTAARDHNLGGRGHHSPRLRASEEDFFGDSDMKAYGSSSIPVTSSRFRRPKKGAHKEGKHRKAPKNDGRARTKRRPVRFPDDEPRGSRSKRHHSRRSTNSTASGHSQIHNEEFGHHLEGKASPEAEAAADVVSGLVEPEDGGLARNADQQQQQDDQTAKMAATRGREGTSLPEHPRLLWLVVSTMAASLLMQS